MKKLAPATPVLLKIITILWVLIVEAWRCLQNIAWQNLKPTFIKLVYSREILYHKKYIWSIKKLRIFQIISRAIFASYPDPKKIIFQAHQIVCNKSVWEYVKLKKEEEKNKDFFFFLFAYQEEKKKNKNIL